MNIYISDCEELRKAIRKCIQLYDCYSKPPVAEGISLTKEYLEKNVYYEDGVLVLKDEIAGGVYGDTVGQILSLLETKKLIGPDTVVCYNGKDTTYSRFTSVKPHSCADMAVTGVNDDPDSDCFRGRKHLLDMFWEGCIEQNPECYHDD